MKSSKFLSFAVLSLLVSSSSFSQSGGHTLENERVAAEGKHRKHIKISSEVIEKIRKKLPKGSEIVTAEKGLTPSGVVYEIKYFLGDEPKSEVFDSGLNPISLPEATLSADLYISEAIRSMLADPSIADKVEFDISMSLRQEDLSHEEEVEIASQVSHSPEGTSISIGGSKVDEKASKEQQDRSIRKMLSKMKKMEAKKQDSKNLISKLLKSNKIDHKGSILDPKDYGRPEISFRASKASIKKIVLMKGLSEKATAIDFGPAIESKDNQTNILAMNLQDAIIVPGSQGDGIGILQSEIYCSPRQDPAPVSGYYYTYNSGNVRVAGESGTMHGLHVAQVLRKTSPLAGIYCHHGAALPTSVELSGITGGPPAWVIAGSWGARDRTSTYSKLSADWDDFAYNFNRITLHSAGNDAAKGWEVTSPSNGLNIVSVGNFDPNTWYADPASQYLNLQDIRNEKPDVYAPGVDWRVGFNDTYSATGTSFSSPAAGGLVANILSMGSWGAYYKTRSAAMRSLLIAGAGGEITLQSQPNTGSVSLAGNVDFNQMVDGYVQSTYWNIANNSIATNGQLETTVSLGLGSHKFAMAYMLKGSWTLTNRATTNPLGMDLDLYVYDPSNRLVCSSVSTRNSSESCWFHVTTAGTYRLVVKRYRNSDTTNQLKVGLSVVKY